MPRPKGDRLGWAKKNENGFEDEIPAYLHASIIEMRTVVANTMRPDSLRLGPIVDQVSTRSLRWIAWPVSVAAAAILLIAGLILLSRLPAPGQEPRDPMAGQKPRGAENQIPPDDPGKVVPNPGTGAPNRGPESTSAPEVIVQQPAPPKAPEPNNNSTERPDSFRIQFAVLKKKIDAERTKHKGNVIPYEDPAVAGIVEEIKGLKDQLGRIELQEVGEFVSNIRRPEETLGMLVPAYFDPTGPGLTNWGRLHTNATKSASIPIIAIAKPYGEGPVENRISSYAQQIAMSTRDNSAKTFKVVGYINCSDRSDEEILADIRKWLSHYPATRGFYFQSHDAKKESAERWRANFAEARRLIIQRGMTAQPLIISNPAGEWDDEFYSSTKPDIVCFGDEQPYGDRLPLWPLNHPKIALAAFQRLDVTDDVADLEAPLNDALSQHLTWFYVGPNRGRSGELPNFLDGEVEKFREINRAIVRANRR